MSEGEKIKAEDERLKKKVKSEGEPR